MNWGYSKPILEHPLETHRFPLLRTRVLQGLVGQGFGLQWASELQEDLDEFREFEGMQGPLSEPEGHHAREAEGDEDTNGGIKFRLFALHSQVGNLQLAPRAVH